MPESIPLPWVQRILQRLSVRYGSRFTSVYAGVEDADLWADWADRLAGHGKDAIAYALEHLPEDSPPNAAQFAALCRRAPVYAAPKLEAPRSDNPALREAARAAVKVNHNDGKEWARGLRDCEAWQAANPREVSKHDVLTLAQRTMWRAALKVEQALS